MRAQFAQSDHIDCPILWSWLPPTTPNILCAQPVKCWFFLPPVKVYSGRAPRLKKVIWDSQILADFLLRSTVKSIKKFVWDFKKSGSLYVWEFDMNRPLGRLKAYRTRVIIRIQDSVFLGFKFQTTFLRFIFQTNRDSVFQGMSDEWGMGMNGD